MALTKTGIKAIDSKNQSIMLDQIEEFDLDPLSYHAVVLGVKDESCSSRKVNKKICRTPEMEAKNLHFKKKRREQVTKSRKATKIYREYTQWNN
jgi:hypothetical protein